MALAFSSRFLALTLLAGVACNAAPPADEQDPDDQTPDVELPQADDWVLQVYKPVMEEAKQLSVDEFLESYPGSEYLKALTYKPGDAAFLAEISEYAGLTPEHDALLQKNGFVAVGEAATHTFSTTYLDLYFNDLPVFISADSLLYALHQSFDAMLLDFERQVLIPEVGRMLQRMHDELGAASKSWPESLQQSARDLDVYLAVARSLLDDWPAEGVTGQAGVDEEVGRILAAVTGLQPENVDLFGVDTLYDFSQMEPRGHYTEGPELQRYFRAMMWLGRTDMAMVTFNEEQQPKFNRRGLDAAFLTNTLLKDSGAQANWDRVDGVLVRLIGERDSMNPQDMTKFMDELGVHSPAELAAADDEQVYKQLISSDYGIQRIMSQIMYTDPTDPPVVLPRVYLLLGQRFTLDSYVFNNVTYDRVQNLATGQKVKRMLPSELDVQFVLGNDAAADHLKPDLDRYGYQGVLHEMRFLADAHPDDFWDSNFYNGWLSAIRALNDDAEFESRPEAMRTAAWADKTLNTQAASWAELRHDTLLYVKQSYSGGDGCEYPDAYVEPLPAFYARLAHLGQLGAEMSQQLGDDGFPVERAQQFYAHLTQTATTLETIAHKELEGAELTQAEFEFLRGTIEQEQVGCGETLYDGWYAQLFYDSSKIAEFKPTIADVHTAPTDEDGNEKGWVLHAGTGRPMLLVFTTPSCSGVKSYIGPVSSFHSHLTEMYDRKTDEDWAEQFSDYATPPRPTWTDSFVR
ncbi:MAG: DUF3160 domain-containing protein [Myxococcales bacterium]|nr:DUF3160 domain-containing protein [Myxococcales bacterium]